MWNLFFSENTFLFQETLPRFNSTSFYFDCSLIIGEQANYIAKKSVKN